MMETARKSSKSSAYGLFLIEQLIVIAVFAVCAAICAKIFSESFIISTTSADMNNAVLVAQSGAEVFKASPDDMDSVAELLGGIIHDSDVLVYYDNNWLVCNHTNALYVLCLSVTPGTDDENGLIFCDVSVERLGDGATAGPIIEFKTAARL